MRWHQKRLHNKRTLEIFKKGINEYFVYIFVNVFDIFFTYFRNIFKKKTKMKFENLTLEVVVCTILNRMVFFFPSGIKIEGCVNFWVRPA